jgi:hypothetical protein
LRCAPGLGAGDSRTDVIQLLDLRELPVGQRVPHLFGVLHQADRFGSFRLIVLDPIVRTLGSYRAHSQVRSYCKSPRDMRYLSPTEVWVEAEIVPATLIVGVIPVERR